MCRPALRLCVVIVLVVASLAQVVEATVTVKLVRQRVHDPAMNGIEAFNFLMPAGWKAEGGIQWFPHHSIQANLLLKLTDPQTGSAVEFLPVQNFIWMVQMVVPMERGSNYMGNILWEPVTDIGQFIQIFYLTGALRHLQGGRTAGVAEMPQVAAAVVQTYGGHVTVRSGRVRYEFVQDGKPWEEDVYVTLVFNPFQMGTLWTVHSACAFRAPKGQLNGMTPLMSTVVNTLRPTQEWYGGYQYVQQLFQNRMQQGIADAAALSRMITQHREEIRQMFAESYRQQQASRDRVARSWSQAIRGVEMYRNPFDQSSVQLPSGYRDVWGNPRGEYLLSNQAGFDPNVGDTTVWQRIEAVPRR